MHGQTPRQCVVFNIAAEKYQTKIEKIGLFIFKPLFDLFPQDSARARQNFFQKLVVKYFFIRPLKALRYFRQTTQFKYPKFGQAIFPFFIAGLSGGLGLYLYYLFYFGRIRARKNAIARPKRPIRPAAQKEYI